MQYLELNIVFLIFFLQKKKHQKILKKFWEIYQRVYDVCNKIGILISWIH